MMQVSNRERWTTGASSLPRPHCRDGASFEDRELVLLGSSFIRPSFNLHLYSHVKGHKDYSCARSCLFDALPQLHGALEAM